MRRAGCKGKTLVLKVKLHTFEVYTRQTVLPRAINLADDLYNHSLPVLAKIEEEKPGMRIRLMGLRCTHLVSTKRPDTMAFFGLRPRSGPVSSEPGKVLRKATEVDDDYEQEIMPDELLRQDEIDDITPGDVIGSAPQAPEEWWKCPICSRPQSTDERQFNAHIDACLSRQTIRDAIQQEQQAQQTRHPTPEPSRPRLGSEKKRRRQQAGPDPKQKRLAW